MAEGNFIKGKELCVNAISAGNLNLSVEGQRIMRARFSQHLLMGAAADHREHRVDLGAGAFAHIAHHLARRVARQRSPIGLPLCERPRPLRRPAPRLRQIDLCRLPVCQRHRHQIIVKGAFIEIEPGKIIRTQPLNQQPFGLRGLACLNRGKRPLGGG